MGSERASQPGRDGALVIPIFTHQDATAGYRAHVRFGVLGTLTFVDDDGGGRRLGGPARRRLLAALVARAGRTVAVDVLIEDLWGDAPPATAEKTLQSHVVRLRDDLGRDDDGSPVRTDPTGYRLAVEPASIDAWCFERDLTAGRRVLAAGDVAAALPLLDQALSWWRGEAYAEFPDAVFAVEERLRLSELRALATEARTDAALASGGAAELVADLELRVRHQPYRERSWEQLVLALYRAGRQGDALATYQRARQRLIEDLGVDPSPPLRELESRVLGQDPSLLGTVGSAQVVALPVSAGTPETVLGSAVPAPLPSERADASSYDGSLTEVRAVAPRCPYPGLRPYEEDDAALFVGRERLTAQLAGRLVDHELVVLAGPSGAGKSSLVRAGLIPALRGGAIPGSSGWRVSLVTPGLDPSASLRGSFGDVVVVDQAEELFTLADAGSLDAVDARLRDLLATGTRVVLCLRADFYGRLAELRTFSARVGAATLLVGPLTEEEVTRVVVEPAAAVGVRVVPALIEQVLDDVRGQTGALPLLSAALERSWAHRTGDQLGLEAYAAGGGVHGALEAMAEDAYRGLPAQGQAAARRILVRLSTQVAGTWVRRPRALGDLVAPGDDVGADSLRHLVSWRLVTVGQGTAELAHEALMTRWPRLRRWLDERAVVSGQLHLLADAALAWEREARPAGDVLRGPRLQAALDWESQHPDDLTPLERDYLAASAAATERELSTERRRRRRLVVASAGLAAAALVAATFGGVAARERTQAEGAALTADARRLAAESYETPDETTALLMAAASFRELDAPDTRGALQNAVSHDGGALWRIQTKDRLLWVGVPRDGSRILVMDNTRSVIAYDAKTHAALTSYRLPGDNVGGLSPDGRTIVTCGPAYGGGQQFGQVDVVDAGGGAVTRTLTELGSQVPNPSCGAFTGDGRWFVLDALVADAKGNRPDPTTAEGDAVAVYDTTSWSSPPRVVRTAAAITALATGGSTFALQLADGTLQVQRASDLAVLGSAHRPELVTDCTSVMCGLALSPDGGRVVYADPARARFPLALDTHALGATPTVGDPLRADTGMYVFSPDGASIAAVDSLGTVRVLDPATLTTLADHTGPSVPTTYATWLPGGDPPALLTVGLDSQLVSWDLSPLPRTVTLGRDVATVNGDQGLYGSSVVGTRPGAGGSQLVYRQDLRTGDMVSWPITPTPGEQGEWVQADADGSRYVQTLYDKAGAMHVLVYDLTDGALLLDRRWPVLPNPHDTLDAGLDADGTHVIVTTGQHQVQVIDVASGAVVRTLDVRLPSADGAQRWLIPLGVDPWGRMVFQAWRGGDSTIGTNDVEQEIDVVDLTTGAVVEHVDSGRVQAGIAWSADRSRAVISNEAGDVRVVDGRTLTPLTALVRAANGYAGAALSPDGSTVVTSGTDGTVGFWDAATMARLGPPVQLASTEVWAWYDTDGTVRGLLPDPRPGSTAMRWFSMPGTPATWLAQACGYAGRDLTTAEWTRYVGDRPQVAVCPSG